MPLSFPPPYTIRKSKRARRISLRIKPAVGLEVVLPYGADPARVPDLIESFRPWIEKHYLRLCAVRSDCITEAPHAFFMKGGAELYMVGYGQPHSALAGMDFRITSGVPVPVPDVIMLEEAALQARQDLPAGGGPMYHSRYAGFSVVIPERLSGNSIPYLQNWLRQMARARLGQTLHELATLHGFTYATMAVRFQKTRWGSCSTKGSISLNGCLMFLPDHLMRYILLHELCHTRAMNHSATFWKELFAVEPEAMRYSQAMRKAWQYVPLWM